MLDKSTVIRALRCPNANLLNLALTYCNLNKKEKMCLTATIIDGDTEEHAAELLGYSRDFVTRHKAAAIKRLQQAWTECPYIDILTDYE